MKDLEFFEVPLGPIKLERLNVCDEKHIKAVCKLRDFQARTMCYDLKGLVDDMKRSGDSSGNPFLVKDNALDAFIGYMYISNRHIGGERVLSYIVNKRLRNKGYGKIMLTSVTDFLFDEELASGVELYIRDANVASKHVAVSCGFESVGESSSGIEKFLIKKNSRVK